MYKKPVRWIFLGNYKWTHWLAVIFFIIIGLLCAIIPSVLAKKIIIGSIILGTVIFFLGLFCIYDNIRYNRNMKIWEENKKNKKQV